MRELCLAMSSPIHFHSAAILIRQGLARGKNKQDLGSLERGRLSDCPWLQLLQLRAFAALGTFMVLCCWLQHALSHMGMFTRP